MVVSAQGFAFVAFASLLILLTVLAIVRVGLLRLESPLGIMRDSLPLGAVAPTWRLPDLAGHARGTPTGTWQLLVFADHSLREFPELVEGIKELRRREPGLEVLMLPSKHPDLAAQTAVAMGLDIPVVPVDRDFYWRHNVRVMPFFLVLDPDGVVRSGGLADDQDGFSIIWRLSKLPPRPGQRTVDLVTGGQGEDGT